jgi:hypothetical protein
MHRRKFVERRRNKSAATSEMLMSSAKGNAGIVGALRAP